MIDAMKRGVYVLLFAASLLAQPPSKPYVSAGVVNPTRWAALGVPVPPRPPVYQIMVTGLPVDVRAVRMVVRYEQDGARHTETRVAEVTGGEYAAAYASIPVSDSPLKVISLVVEQLKASQSDEFAPGESTTEFRK